MLRISAHPPKDSHAFYMLSSVGRFKVIKRGSSPKSSAFAFKRNKKKKHTHTHTQKQV